MIYGISSVLNLLCIKQISFNSKYLFDVTDHSIKRNKYFLPRAIRSHELFD